MQHPSSCGCARRTVGGERWIHNKIFLGVHNLPACLSMVNFVQLPMILGAKG